MSRRIAVALIGFVVVAVVLAGGGGLLLARRAAVADAEADLGRQVESLATVVSGRGLDRRTGPVADAVRRAFELTGFEVVALNDPSVRSSALAAVAEGRTVTYRDGGELVAVASSASGLAAVVGTRSAPGGFGPAGPWVLLSSIVVVVAAAAVSVALSRRLTTPVRQVRNVAGRIAAGDLGARVGDLGDDEIGELGRSIDAMAASLETSREAQRSFFLSVSHDLRTPLTSIRGFGELLSEDADAERARMGARIESEAKRLERLVSDLLDLARVDAAGPSLHMTSVDLLDVVRSVHADTAGASVLVRADPDRLAQVVANLVDNAVGFAASTVSVTVGVDGSVAVEDDGPGIPPDVLPHVFDRFATTRPRAGGTGLGLAIAKELTEAMGGRISVACPPTGGTRFVVALPLASRA